MRAIVGLLAFVGVTALAAVAQAQGGLGDGRPVGDLPPMDATERGLVESRSAWELREPRTFVAGTVDLGFLYGRPRFLLGHGRPHWEWVGLEVVPTISTSRLGAYAGLRGELPQVDVHVGARYTYSLFRSYLEPRNRYTREAIEIEGEEAAQHWTIESEVSSSLAVGPGSILTIFTLSYVLGVPEDRYVFEESVRAVVAPPWAWRGRIGYVFRLGDDPPASFGPAAEVVGLPERNELVLRAGAVVSVLVFDDLEVLGTFLPVVDSPDSLGLDGGDFGHLGIRYRWATGFTPW